MVSINKRHTNIFFHITAHLIKTVLLLLAVSIMAFTLVSLSPVNPVQQYLIGQTVSAEQRAEVEAYWGINEPPVTRYLHWLREVLHGNLGESLLYRRPVSDIICERFTRSFILMLCAWSGAGLLGFTLGCVMGSQADGRLDRILKKICYVCSSMPAFWLGLLLLLLFAVQLQWFPLGFSIPVGMRNEDVTLWQRLHHLFLPALTLILTSFSNIALHTREKLIDILSSDYVYFARARGESMPMILRRHGLRNIIFPALTLQFSSFAELFGGSVIAENVFSYPGLGTAVSEAGLGGDIPLLLGITLFSALFVCIGNAIANLLYGIIDPQIREE